MKNVKVVKLEGYMPSEFSAEESVERIFAENGLMIGRMITGSKSGYREIYPDHEVVFNANIVTESRGKCWFGDLDFFDDSNKLQEIAKILKEPLYVLCEMDARFGNENKPIEFYKERAVVKIDIK